MKTRVAVIILVVLSFLVPLISPHLAKAQFLYCLNYDFNGGSQLGWTPYSTTRGIYAAWGGTFWYHDPAIEDPHDEALEISSPDLSAYAIRTIKIYFSAEDGPSPEWGIENVGHGVAYTGSASGSNPEVISMAFPTMTTVGIFYYPNASNNVWGPPTLQISRVDICYDSPNTPTPTNSPTPTSTSQTIPDICPPTIYPTWTTTPGPTSTGTPYTATPSLTPSRTPTNTPTAAATLTLTPTPTGTFSSPTPGPSPTPNCIPSPPINPNACPLLGDDVSIFAKFPGEWAIINSDKPSNPPGASKGLYIKSGTIEYQVQLNPTHKYSIVTQFHLKVVGSSPPVTGFSVKLGMDKPILIPVHNDLTQQTLTVPAANYNPSSEFVGAKLYNLDVSRQALTADPYIIIDYLCVTDPAAGTYSHDTGPVCPTCFLNVTLDTSSIGSILSSAVADVGNFFSWLWCRFLQWINCSLIPFFQGLWQTIVDIARFLGWAFMWVLKSAGSAIQWVLDNLGVIFRWLGGSITNIITSLLHNIGFSLSLVGIQLGIPDLGQFLSLIWNFIGTLFHLIIGWVISFVGLIVTIISVIFQIFSAMLSGFNASASSIPMFAPICDTPGQFLYYPCVGIYILDNTIWAGILYYIVYVAEALIALRVFWWAIKFLEEAILE